MAALGENARCFRVFGAGGFARVGISTPTKYRASFSFFSGAFFPLLATFRRLLDGPAESSDSSETPDKSDSVGEGGGFGACLADLVVGFDGAGDASEAISALAASAALLAARALMCSVDE